MYVGGLYDDVECVVAECCGAAMLAVGLIVSRVVGNESVEVEECVKGSGFLGG